MSEWELLGRIQQTFFGVAAPRGALTFCPCEDCRKLADFFGTASPWQLFPLQELEVHGPSLCQFTPPAYRYYLPAFLIGEIRDVDRRTDIATWVMREFDEDNFDTWADRRLILFTPPQRDVLLLFCEFVANKHESFHSELRRARSRLRGAEGHFRAG